MLIFTVVLYIQCLAYQKNFLLNICCTFRLAPPCRGPLSDAIDAATAEYVSVPEEVTTWAIARIAGWGAHRVEELINAGKIIRLAYKSISERVEYVPLDY